MTILTKYGSAIPAAVHGDRLVCWLPCGNRIIRASEATDRDAFVAAWRSLGGAGQRLQFADGQPHHPFPQDTPNG